MVAFTGGDKLQAKLAEIAKRVQGKHSLKVGFLEGATYPDESGTPVAQVAFWLNYGTKTSPARPFFTDMIDEKSSGWGDALLRLLKLNNYDVDAALEKLGDGISGQVRDALVNLHTPPLSKITLMLRKMKIENPDLEVTGAVVGEAARRVDAGESTAPASTKVGVYSGHLLNSVAYEVNGDEP